MRFLSHAETLRVLQRACVRARISIRYSHGFNPRPRLSLPLPRPVGVESDDELLCLRCSIRNTQYAILDTIKAELSAQLPEGIELLSVRAARPGVSFQPRSATYVFAVRPEYLNDELRATIGRLLASENLNIQRQTGAGSSRIKNIDVRPFLTSIEMTGQDIIVECKISPAGSIRVDEVLSLLQLDQDMLAGPIRRTNVRWR